MLLNTVSKAVMVVILADATIGTSSLDGHIIQLVWSCWRIDERKCMRVEGILTHAGLLAAF
jgi:hypothetical protein